VTARIAALVAAAALLASCGSDDDRLLVLGASSLRDVFPAIDDSPEYAFGGSGQLALQVLEGARSDVIATAGTGPMEQLVDAGAVGPPVVFATNRLVIVVPRGNPAGVRALDDLGEDGTVVVLADAGVPAGDYAREALTRAGLETALERVASFEDDVRGVLTKVALREADAGIVYATDVRAAADDVEGVDVPDRFQPEVEYVAAAVTTSARAHVAHAFLARLRSEEGRDVLVDAGFGLP
jgi:molybdate transport system substrate-binding protein